MAPRTHRAPSRELLAGCEGLSKTSRQSLHVSARSTQRAFLGALTLQRNAEARGPWPVKTCPSAKAPQPCVLQSLSLQPCGCQRLTGPIGAANPDRCPFGADPSYPSSQ